MLTFLNPIQISMDKSNQDIHSIILVTEIILSLRKTSQCCIESRLNIYLSQRGWEWPEKHPKSVPLLQYIKFFTGLGVMRKSTFPHMRSGFLDNVFKSLKMRWHHCPASLLPLLGSKTCVRKNSKKAIIHHNNTGWISAMVRLR